MNGDNISELFLHIKLGLEKIGENRILLNSIETNDDKRVILDDYNNLFSGNSYIELTGTKNKCCF